MGNYLYFLAYIFVHVKLIKVDFLNAIRCSLRCYLLHELPHLCIVPGGLLISETALEGCSTKVGAGKTFNISSGGIFLQTGGALPTGGEIELLMQWPFFLDSGCPLKLVVQGRIVRSDANGIAVQTLRHEFRTSKRPVA